MLHEKNQIQSSMNFVQVWADNYSNVLYEGNERVT